MDIDANGISVLAASDALAGLHRIDGRGAARAALKTRGGNVRELVGALGGDGSVTVKDGAVLGINIAGMLRQVMTLGLDSAAGEQQRTDFAEAGASFQIANGILRTQDLHLSAPVLRLEGAGAVDLPQRTIDMRVTPKLATTLQGQGASGEPVLQAGIPFVVQGPYASPSVRFDLNGTLTSAIDGPEDVAQSRGQPRQEPRGGEGPQGPVRPARQAAGTGGGRSGWSRACSVKAAERTRSDLPRRTTARWRAA